MPSLAEGGKSLSISGTVTTSAVDSYAFTSFESATSSEGLLGTYSENGDIA